MNWDLVEQLLNICDTARQWPRLSKIHDLAMAELVAINDAKPEDETERKRR